MVNLSCIVAIYITLVHSNLKTVAYFTFRPFHFWDSLFAVYKDKILGLVRYIVTFFSSNKKAACIKTTENILSHIILFI